MELSYGNLAQTGGVMAPVAGITTGSWVVVAAVAGVVGIMALYKLVTPSAKARP